ncbi:MAG: hypothetical protein U5K54_00655 [Cytophagales bacterium]|nr:hypothetical protein [Cytophagales bacterium]
MKTAFYFVLSLLIFSSCASTKTVSKTPSPTGLWDYLVTGTPEGDFNGVMTISEVDKVHTAKLEVNGEELIIEKFIYNKETKKMSGEFDYQGTPIYFDAALIVDDIEGGMAGGGMTFPFNATRKK